MKSNSFSNHEQTILFEDIIPTFDPARFDKQQIREEIYRYYHQHKRTFSWRENITPYRVVVSEIMLQQTQTHRVAQKFDTFIAAFPDFSALAAAPFKDVLALWQGLGYSRRALALHKIAQEIVANHGTILPNDPGVLINFPGIGKATAASICAFAFNKPTVFIETNIRAVFIHLFFTHEEAVPDLLLMPLVELTLDTTQPREWYYALMDYGVMLKKRFPNPSRKSKHHTTQSPFEGSDRQIRGMILKLLVSQSLTQDELFAQLGKEETRCKKILQQLISEKFVRLDGTIIKIA